MGEVVEEKVEKANAWLLRAAVFVVSLQILLILTVLVSFLPSTYTREVADFFSGEENSLFKNMICCCTGPGSLQYWF